ncbi:reverse transcriptase, partial [Phytophthora megakarya]
MKKVLRGDVSDLPRNQVKKIAKISDQFVLDSREVLYRLSTPTPERPRNKQSELRLVVPETLCADMLHYSHKDFQGGHQGINRTFERLRSEFYWIGMYADVQKFVRECVDCASAKGQSRSLAHHLTISNRDIRSRWSLWILSLSYLSPIVEIPTCCCSKINSQDISCANPCGIPKPKVLLRHTKSAYSEDLGHDQDPRFLSKVFARFRDLLKSKQRATLGYRPQANGQQERSGTLSPNGNAKCQSVCR